MCANTDIFILSYLVPTALIQNALYTSTNIDVIDNSDKETSLETKHLSTLIGRKSENLNILLIISAKTWLRKTAVFNLLDIWLNLLISPEVRPVSLPDRTFEMANRKIGMWNFIESLCSWIRFDSIYFFRYFYHVTEIMALWL